MKKKMIIFISIVFVLIPILLVLLYIAATIFVFPHVVSDIKDDIYKTTHPATKQLNFYYAKDNRNIYFGCDSYLLDGFICEKIEEADYATFKSLGESSYAMDKSTVYYKGKKMEGVDRETFILSKFTQDRSGNFELPDENNLVADYSKDKNRVYYLNRPLINSESKSWKYLADTYSKDAHYVYFEDRPLLEADLPSFEHLRLSYGDIGMVKNIPYYAKDKKNLYYDGYKVPHISSTNVTVAGEINDRYVWNDKVVLFQRYKKTHTCEIRQGLPCDAEFVLLNANASTFREARLSEFAKIVTPSVWWEKVYTDGKKIFFQGNEML